MLARLRQVFGWLDAEYDKVAVERVLLDAPHLQTTVLRLPIVHGPGDNLRRFRPLVERIDAGRRAIIVPAAAWRASRGYVEDVAAAAARAATAEPPRRVYNVGEAEAPSELEWARLVAAAAGFDGGLVALPDDRLPPHLRLPGNTAQHLVADTSAIRRDLALAPPLPRAEAVSRTVAWERATPAAPVATAADYAAEDAALAAR